MLFQSRRICYSWTSILYSGFCCFNTYTDIYHFTISLHMLFLMRHSFFRCYLETYTIFTLIFPLFSKTFLASCALWLTNSFSFSWWQQSEDQILIWNFIKILFQTLRLLCCNDSSRFKIFLQLIDFWDQFSKSKDHGLGKTLIINLAPFEW